MVMNNKVYDVLKWVALIVLPALATLYATLSELWGLPYGVQICGTLTAIGTFLGALLQVSASKYAKSIMQEK